MQLAAQDGDLEWAENVFQAGTFDQCPHCRPLGERGTADWAGVRPSIRRRTIHRRAQRPPGPGRQSGPDGQGDGPRLVLIAEAAEVRAYLATPLHAGTPGNRIAEPLQPAGPRTELLKPNRRASNGSRNPTTSRTAETQITLPRRQYETTVPTVTDRSCRSDSSGWATAGPVGQPRRLRDRSGQRVMTTLRALVSAARPKVS